MTGFTPPAGPGNCPRCEAASPQDAVQIAITVRDSQSGALKGQPYSFRMRFEDESGKSGTNPEELIAAAHAGCYAMQFSHFLAENGTPASRLEARAAVTLAANNHLRATNVTIVFSCLLKVITAKRHCPDAGEPRNDPDRPHAAPRAPRPRRVYEYCSAFHPAAARAGRGDAPGRRPGPPR